MIVCFYIYAYNNPDADAYYVEGHDGQGPELVSNPNETTMSVDPIHNKFVTWFTWMFWSSLVWFLFSFFAMMILW